MSFRQSWLRLFALGAWLLPAAAWAQDQDVLRITAGAAFERHSNLFRASERLSAADFNTAYGKTSRGDTILRGTLGFGFDREFSLQRFRANAVLLPQKFQTYSRFDHLGYRADVNWDWEFAGPLSGTVGARVDYGLMGFNQILVRSGAVASQVDKNMITRTNPYFTGRLRITPSWFVVGGVDQVRVVNSATAFLSGNFTDTGGEAGVRFAPGTGTIAEFVVRSSRGKYDYLQLTDYLGQNLPQGVDNSYKQTHAMLRLQVRPSEDTTIGGSIGYMNRRYDATASRNFTGPTAELTLDWRPSGAFYLNTRFDRSIALPGIFSSSYIDVTRLTLAPRVVLTGKTAMTGLLEVSTWDYKGDPGLVGSGLVRKDNMQVLGAGVLYEYSRAVTFNADFRHERRTSNIVNGDFTNNVIIGGVTGRF